jgi:hypothetical protein
MNQLFLCMPLISSFYGLLIYMYYLDNKQHHFPHIHVKFQDMEAVLRIPDGFLMDGNLPTGKLKLVAAWIELHQDELMADWELACSGQKLFNIEPLR